MGKREGDTGTGPYTFGWGRRTPPCTAWACDFHLEGGKYHALFFNSPDGLRWNTASRVRCDALPEDDNGDTQCAAYLYDESGQYAPYNYLAALLYRRESGVDRAHVRFLRSQDGVHYEPFPGGPVWYGPGDVMCFLWDETKQRYVVYYKIYEIKGFTKRGKPFSAHSPSFDVRKKKKVSARVSGWLYQGGDLTKPMVKTNVKLRYGGDTSNDGGGVGTDRVLSLRRVIAYAESRDFLHWENERVIITPPERAALGDQGYGICVAQRHGMYIGMYQYFNSLSGVIDLILAWSYDGVHWSLNWDDRILTAGESGAWDAGMVFGPEFFDTGDGRMCLYYGSLGVDHRVPDGAAQIGGVGRAWLRRDGYASLSGGAVETVPLTVRASKFSLNMRGRIQIAVKSPGGDVLASGVARGDGCRVIAPVDMRPFAGQEVVLSMDLTEGEVFSISL